MNKLNQYSTMAGLFSGNYDGQFRLQDVLKGNDFGIGTFEAIEGELIGFDNEFYRLQIDGTVVPVKSKDLTPFVSLTNFKNPVLLPLPSGSKMNDLLENLVKEVNPNRIYALKITGSFSMMQTRIVPKQTKPYVNFAEAVKKQVIFNKHDETGTVVGFLSPALFSNVMSEGLHLHYLNESKSFGGHVLDFKAEEVKLEIIEIDQLRLFFDKTKKELNLPK